MSRQWRITSETITGISLILGSMAGFWLGDRVGDMLWTLELGITYNESAAGLVASLITFVVSVLVWKRRRDLKKNLAWDIGLAFVASALFCGAMQLAILSLSRLLWIRPDFGPAFK